MNIPNPEVKASNHFTWKELLYLPSWNRMANESDGLTQEILDNLNSLALKMDQVRNYFNSSINVHCCYRPEAYNQLVGGAPNSSHKKGLAMDLDITGMSCDRVRQILVNDNLLEQWNLWCEDRPGSNWVHLNMDDGIKRSSRLFKP